MLTYVNWQLNAKEERLWRSFCKIDLDGDGKITIEELKKTVGKDDEKALKVDLDD